MGKHFIASCVLVALLLSLWPTPGFGTVDPFSRGKVGDIGLPEHLLVEGCKAFTPEQLRRGLLADWEVQVASSPSTDLQDYVDVIRRKLNFGYLSEGFPDVQVSVGSNAAQGVVIATIVEGPRYRRGPVHVTGAKVIPVDRLIQKLTSNDDSESISGTVDADGTVHVGMEISESKGSATWKQGKYTRFDPYSQRYLREDIEKALAGLGYFAAQFTFSIDVENGQSALKIDIQNEGPHAVLKSIAVEGLKKSSPQEMQAFLEVKVGQPITAYDVFDIQRRLWHSGRYKKHLMTVRPVDGKSKLELRLELEEEPDAPPISQPLTEVEQAALKCREWLLSRVKSGEDLTAIVIPKQTVLAGARFQMTIGQTGIAARLRMPASQSSTTAPKSVEYFAAIAESGIRLYNVTEGRKLVAGASRTFGGEIKLAYGYEVEKDGALRSTFNLGAGVNSKATTFAFHLDLAPAKFLELAHRADLHYEVHAGVVTATNANGKLHVRIESATGRLLECKFEEDTGSMELSARRGALADEAAAMEKAVPGGNAFDPEHPVGSTLAFVAGEVARSPLLLSDARQSQQALVLDALGRLLSPAVLSPLDEALTTLMVDEDFSPPQDPRDEAHGGNPLTGLILHYTVPVTDRSFDRASWPWTLVRLQLLAFAGLKESLDPELNRVMIRDDVGPLGHLAVAKFVKPFSATGGERVANEGMGRLDAESFRKDAAAIIGGKAVVPTILRGMADELRRLPRDDVDALAELMPPDRAKIFQKFAAALRARSGEPIEKVLPDALDSAWADGLRQQVERALKTYLPDESLATIVDRASLHLKRAEFDRALEDTTHVLDSKNVTLKLASMAFAIRGGSYARIGQNEKAIADCTHAIESPAASNETVIVSLVYRALGNMNLGHNDLTIADCTRALQMQGTTPDQVILALTLRGIANMALGNGAQAVADETSAVETRGAAPVDVARAIGARADMYAKLGQMDLAAADNDRIIDITGAPPDMIARALLSRGNRLGRLGQRDKEIADDTRVIEMEGTSPDSRARALLNRGVNFGRLNDPEREIADYTRAIEMTNAPREHVAMGLLYRAITYDTLKENDKAVADYSRVIAMQGAPGNLVVRAIMSRVPLYARLGKNEKNIPDLSRLIDAKGVPRDVIVDALMARAGCYQATHDAPREIADFGRVIEMADAPADTRAKALFFRGIAYHQAMKRTDKAIIDLTAIIDMKGVPVEWLEDALGARGQLHGELGHNETAIADFSRVLEIKGLAPEMAAKVLGGRALRYRAVGQLDKEIADETRIIEMKNVSPGRTVFAIEARGMAYGKLKQFEKEIADFTRVIDMKEATTEQRAAALDRRGWSRYKLAQLDEALDDDRRAFAMDPRLANASSNAGTILLRQGKLDEARKGYEAALPLRSPMGSTPGEGVIDDLIELRDKLHGPAETTVFLGWLYCEAGQRDKGLNELKAYLRDHPHGELAPWAHRLLVAPPTTRAWHENKP